MRKRATLVLTPILAVMLSCAGPEGPQGPAGTSADVGQDGTPCYASLDDQNGDGVVDQLDCRGLNGLDGIDGVDGQDGIACWDLNGDGIADLSSEDRNGDGQVDALDCQGQDAVLPDLGVHYVGSQACAACHVDIAAEHKRSGHPHVMRELGDARPRDLQDAYNMSDVPDNGNSPLNPPTGYAWTDLAYQLGGWGWQTRYVDKAGYIVTCPKGDVDSDGDGFCDNECGGTNLTACGDPANGDARFVNQWNQADGSWSSYERGVFHKAHDCAHCHTTGYQSEGTTLNADGATMPGNVGSWNEVGVGCEACHGPGSQHIADPEVVSLKIEREAEACGKCHSVGDPAEIHSDGHGFLPGNEQWNQMFSSKKHIMNCSDCHDPHQSAHFADATFNARQGLQTRCETCHFNEAARQNASGTSDESVMKFMLSCTDCHMPRVAVSAMGDVRSFSGDMRAHLFAINPNADAPQLSDDGTQFMPYLTLDYSCRACHPDSEQNRFGQEWSVKTDQELQISAEAYHD